MNKRQAMLLNAFDLKRVLKKLLAPIAISLLFSGSAFSYEVISVTDGATITGKVIYQGRVKVKKIIPTKDKEVCGGARDQAQILVGPDKGVQDAVVYLKKVPKGKAWAKQEKTPVLDQEKCKFVPAIQVMRAGKLDIINSDPVLHNTHGFYGRRTAFNLALPDKGTKIPVDLTRPGLVRVECDAHGWMLAHVYVADSPYYVLTGKDGSFSITDIPPGNYTLVVAQHHVGKTEQAVAVKSGETVKLSVELK